MLAHSSTEIYNEKDGSKCIITLLKFPLTLSTVKGNYLEQWDKVYSLKKKDLKSASIFIAFIRIIV